ncbi:hypothetical protein OB905_01540 [Halobacteria archaeon AArc-dxtr1]|nr:hypothetical protein [Halobacteria archaeon AArc-dxtr1]
MEHSNRDTKMIRGTYDWSQTVPSLAVLDAIAKLEGVATPALQIVLYDHIDPDALDALLTTEKAVTVRFQVEGYQIQIVGDELTVSLVY